jgi:hypothetical protein
MTAEDVIRILQLVPLEMEGGFFRETYRSHLTVPAGLLPPEYTGARSLGTAIYYMVTPESFSRLHRVPGTEVFHFYLGDPAEMLQLLPDGSSQTVTLGTNLDEGERPQVVVRGGIWQGCKLKPGGKFALLATTMSPGFDYADYENGDRAMLVKQYPGAAESIREYTK